jgi:hypothetical protein
VRLPIAALRRSLRRRSGRAETESSHPLMTAVCQHEVGDPENSSRKPVFAAGCRLRVSIRWCIRRVRCGSTPPGGQPALTERRLGGRANLVDGPRSAGRRHAEKPRFSHPGNLESEHLLLRRLAVVDGQREVLPTGDDVGGDRLPAPHRDNADHIAGHGVEQGGRAIADRFELLEGEFGLSKPLTLSDNETPGRHRAEAKVAGERVDVLDLPTKGGAGRRQSPVLSAGRTAASAITLGRTTCVVASIALESIAG